MLIRSVVVLFLALQESEGSRRFRISPKDVPGCSPVGYTARRTFLEEHNRRRASLANGELKIGDKQLPTAANMLFMAYDCKLEEQANKLTTGCRTASEIPQFDKTRMNVAEIESRIDNGEISAPREAVSQWWNKSSEWQNPQTLTMEDNSANPFFLMAQAEGDKVGCSVRKCKKAGAGASYYSVACVYKKEVEVGSELYKQGTPCSKCTDDYTLHKDGLCKKPKQKQ